MKLASGSRDPQAYALAFLSCRYTGGGACDLLSAEQWAEIEPDNGVPWLLVASSAGTDAAARNRAVVRASATERFDTRLPDYLGMLQWPQLRNQPPQTRDALADVLMGMQTTLPMIAYTPFIEYCRDPSVAEATRTSVCSNLATVLLADRTILGFSTGVRLAELAGWPPDRIGPLRELKFQYQSAFRGALLRGRNRLRSDCEDPAAFDRWAAEYSSLGDRGLAMKFIEETRSSAASRGR